ncbi:beta-ketoacyl synthase N-terminal-like domain-containing protein [Virgisporangium ochraceum]|uniref:Polyketide synthase n=1 Tax=Virgisporangium ochraceum TaxID=65505 RepID=A0A8J4ECR5_9ACTN|nr:beta-ketoacyl synthase N-terminal-like domain-containing protein [Virgisporangium ochraceum]GIJ67167.1 polyketide synthase [Virgisporangium ochraceum]
MEPVAVVGMSVLLPGAPDLDTYWRNLVGGVDCITPVPASYGLTADVFPAGRGGFLGDLAAVDAAALGVMPAALPHTEPDQLIALHVATAALADAGPLGDPRRVGVILGRGGYFTAGMARMDLRTRTVHQVAHLLAELGFDDGTRQRVREAFLARLDPPSRGAEIGLVPNLTASRIANRLGLGGPAYTVDAACASSLVAIDHAVGELNRGRCDAVLVGGVHHAHEPGLWTVFDRLGAVSGSGAIRPFDRSADGLLIGEGTGVVVLKRLADARRAGDRVYAVVRGTGVASDGGGASLMHPGTGGQVEALRQAWAAAGLDAAAPGSIGLLEAHGTGTPAGDTAELATLREVFGAGAPAVLGSVKSMIGHTMPAAGIAGFIKAALAVHHGMLLPTLHCDDPHPDLAATRFRPIDTAREWPDGVRRAAVNAFGFGGINAHVVLEGEPRATRPVRVREPEPVLRLAAPTVADLADRLDHRHPSDGRPSSDGPCRIAVVAPTERTLATARRVLAAGRPWRGRQDIWFSPRPLLDGGRIAFLYPGLEADFDPRVSDVAAHLGWPVPDLGTESLFRQGSAVLWVGRLLDAALRAHGVRPDVLAGHSIGEWTATGIAAGYTEAEIEPVLAAFADAAREVPDVVFGVLGEPAGAAARRLAGTTVTVSHDNSPHQSVVCGPAVEVERVLAAARADGVLGQVLPFRSGFHTPRLRPYLDRFAHAAAGLEPRPWREPVWSATTVAPYPDDPADVRALHTRHLLEPVRFRPLVERLYETGVRAFVQVGVGQLASLVHDVLRGREHLAVAASSPRQTGLGQLTRVLAALWVEGARVGDELLGAVASRRERVRLALGSPLVSLGPGAAGLAPVRPEAAGPVPAAPRVAHTGIAAMVAEAEEAALAVLTATRSRSTAPEPRREVPVRTQTRDMSLGAMPYLRDHTFFSVPANWPDPYDGFPVVPATELVRQLADFARDSAPGRVAVAVREARFERWLAVEPPVRVTFEGTRVSAARMAVVVRGYARATVDLDEAYPPPPARWPTVSGRAPLLTAREVYDRRWMFHGPGYRGITGIDSIGPDHVVGELTVPDAPGGLLDAAGQLVGYWVLEECEEDNRTFPVRIGELRTYSPEPPVGERVTCHARVLTVTATTVVAALQLVRADGTVWAEADGWQLRRFAYGPEVQAVDRGAGTELLARRQAEGWCWVGEAWPDLASRELMARTYLTRDEWDAYERQPPQRRRRWLLGRVAVKDAVRGLVRDREPAGEVFPAELTVEEDDGRPWVRGRFDRTLPELAVSLAHAGEVGVAIVRSAGPIGIDVVEVSGTGTTADTARFRAAKGAAARAMGGAEGGAADDLEITGVFGDDLLVRDVLVRVTDLTYDGRRYVVAWTPPASER